MTWTALALALLLADQPAPDVTPARLAPPELAAPLVAYPPARADGKPFTCSVAGVVDVATGRILFGRNLTERRSPASTTKIVTTLVALEMIERGEAKLSDVVLVSATAAAVPESGIWLEAGERMTLRDLLIGVMVRSANDASMAVAEHLGGGRAQVFVDRMNQRMRELGAVGSNFVNPHGLHAGMNGEPIGDQHYVTGYDLLLATQTAWRFPFFRELCVMDREPISWENLSSKPDEQHESQRIIGNRNKLLDRYDACCGVKTGYTRQAGPCLVSAARGGGRVVLAVTLNSASGDDRWAESEALLRWGLEQYTQQTVLKAGEAVCEVPVAGGNPAGVQALAADGVEYLLHRRMPAPYLEIRPVRNLAAPLLAGVPVGSVTVVLPDGARRSVTLLAAGDVSLSTEALWRRYYGPLVLALLVGMLTYGAAAEAHRRRRAVQPSRGRGADR